MTFDSSEHMDGFPSLEPMAGKESLRIAFGAKSIASENPKKHGENEDAFFTLPLPDKKIWLAGVFDGMSGEKEARAASTIANNFITRYFQDIYNESGAPSEEALKRHMSIALQGADLAVTLLAPYLTAKGDNMGTTGDILCFFDTPAGNRKAIVGHLGDGRVYMQREGKLDSYTIDDGFMTYELGKRKDIKKADIRKLQEKFDNTTDPETLSENKGDLPHSEREYFDRRNELAKAIGYGSMDPSVFVLNVQKGDRILMCTDGVSDNLTLSELQELMAEPNPAHLTTEHIADKSLARSRDRSNPRHKQDDITAIVIDPFG